MENNVIDVDKIGSATSPLGLARTLSVTGAQRAARAGDVVVVRVLTDNATYNMLELRPAGWQRSTRAMCSWACSVAVAR